MKTLGLISLGVAAIVLVTTNSLRAVGAVLVGWTQFLANVLPRVTIAVPSLVMGGVALVLFAVGLHWLGTAFSKQLAKRPWKVRWSCTIVVTVFLAFAAGIAIVGIAHQVVWLARSEKPLVEEAAFVDGSLVDNFTWIGLGIHNYHDNKKRLPGGSSLHSWETQILNNMLYEADYDRMLPWTDEKNVDFFKHIVPSFLNPRLKNPPIRDEAGFGLSHLSANSHVIGSGKVMTLSDIKDGTSNTILVGEVNTGFKAWGDPDNSRDPANGINTPEGFGGAPQSRGAYFIMADGSVKFVSEDVSRQVLRALATPADGDVVPDGTLVVVPRDYK